MKFLHSSSTIHNTSSPSCQFYYLVHFMYIHKYIYLFIYYILFIYHAFHCWLFTPSMGFFLFWWITLLRSLGSRHPRTYTRYIRFIFNVGCTQHMPFSKKNKNKTCAFKINKLSQEWNVSYLVHYICVHLWTGKKQKTV